MKRALPALLAASMIVSFTLSVIAMLLQWEMSIEK